MSAGRSASAPRPVAVGYDGSAAAGHAVDVAVDEAGQRGTALVVLVVAGSSRLWSDSVEELYGDAGAALAWATDMGDAAVHQAVQRCPGLPVDAVVCGDLESPEIVALGHRAQLLVLGGQGRRGQACLHPGATSAELALAFRCPVLITRPPGEPAASREVAGASVHDRPGGSVVAGVDGRESSVAVLAAAARECRLRDRALVAVHAMGSSVVAPQHLADRCRRLFGDAVTSMGPGHADRLLFAPGTPARALAGNTRPEDLLVIGTHSRGRLRAGDSNGVIRQVLDQAPCDVLVVPSARA